MTVRSGRGLAGRLYGLLLLAYPREFRNAVGDDAVRAFVEVHRDAAARGLPAVVRLWGRTVPAVLTGGFRERFERRDPSRSAGGVAPVADGRTTSHHGPGVRTGRSRGSVPAELVRDVRLALRLLVRRPGFAVATIGLIALGIGATTTIFSVVYGVLLRPLPYPASDRLVHLMKNSSSMPIPDYVDIRDRSRALEAVAAAHNTTADLTGSGQPERLGLSLVTREMFDILGARAFRGRLFADDEFEPGTNRVVVLTMGLWLRRWGGDESVIGRTVVLNGEPATVVGVLDGDFVPPEALGLDRADLYMPLDLTEAEYQNRNMYVLAMVGRTRAGLDFEATRSDMEALAASFRADGLDGWVGRDGTARDITLNPLMELTVSGAGNVLWMFLGAVALMLAIACANVANLFLARSTERTHEMAVRSALGAGRRRLMAQLLTESTTLALAGGAAGVLLTYVGVLAFRVLDPGGIPRASEISINAPVLAFAVVLSVVTGIAFGLAPALYSAGTGAASAMRETGSATTATRARSRIRGTLVVLQLAMALVLLAGAGILFDSFLNLRGVEPGFEPENLLTVQLDTEARVPGPQRAAFVHRLEERLAALPGVTAVGSSWRLPFDRGRCCWSSRMVDATAESDTVQPYMHPVTEGYFAALGARFVEGRPLNASDATAGVIPVGESEIAPASLMPVVVSRRLAERLWPGEPAVGHSLRMPGEPTEFRVVGVIEGIRHWRLDADLGMDLYLPWDATAAWDLGLLDVGIRHDAGAAGLGAAVRRVFLDADDQLPLDRIVPMESRIAGSIATPRFYAALLGTFALLAFLLAAAGVYSSMLYVVGLRRRELGIRAALGAARGDLLRLVVLRAATLVVLGTLAGVVAALALGRVLESLTFGVSAHDPRTLAVVSGLLATVGLVACLVPARRAARADPVSTLRAS